MEASKGLQVTAAQGLGEAPSCDLTVLVASLEVEDQGDAPLPLTSGTLRRASHAGNGQHRTIDPGAHWASARTPRDDPPGNAALALPGDRPPLGKRIRLMEETGHGTDRVASCPGKQQAAAIQLCQPQLQQPHCTTPRHVLPGRIMGKRGQRKPFRFGQLLVKSRRPAIVWRMPPSGFLTIPRSRWSGLFPRLKLR